MMKKLILLIIFFVAIFYFADLNIRTNQEDGDWDNKVVIGECEFRLEFVSDNVSRQRGLSNRDNLCDKCGMFFEFPTKDKQSFWMKDMNFDLDIIWIADNEVVSIEKNVAHNFKGTLLSPSPADKVLEINAGKSDECNIKRGSILNFSKNN